MTSCCHGFAGTTVFPLFMNAIACNISSKPKWSSSSRKKRYHFRCMLSVLCCVVLFWRLPTNVQRNIKCTRCATRIPMHRCSSAMILHFVQKFLKSKVSLSKSFICNSKHYVSVDMAVHCIRREAMLKLHDAARAGWKSSCWVQQHACPYLSSR